MTTTARVPPPSRARRLLPVALAIAALQVGSVAPARAQPEEKPELDQADVFFQKGNTAYRDKKWQEAYDAYTQAFALKQSYDIAGNLGDVELMLGKHRDAAEHLAFSLRNWPALRLEQKKRTAERLAVAKQSIGVLVINVDQAGAEITVNGRVVGKSPLPGPVYTEPGPVSVEAKLEGKTATRTVGLGQGEEKDVGLRFNGAATPPPSGTEPGAAKAGPGSSPAGPDATRDDRTWWERRNWAPAIVGGALTAAAVGAFVYFKIREGSAKDDQSSLRDDLGKKGGSSACSGSSQPSACADLRDAVDRESTAQDWSNVSLIAAGALAAGTVTAFLLWPERKPERSGRQASGTTLSFVPSHSGAFFSVQAAF